MNEVKFWQGNKACAYAAIHAGCTFFAGYPITPASEIAEQLSKLLPTVNGNFIQMEDEIGAISAIIGSAWGGARAMTATSGPGFSLMQEGISYAIMTETPIVIVDVQRTGPSTGQATKTAQGDFMQARWGNHGDHSIIVLSPNSVQEFYDMTIRAFDLSEKYRTPVIILSDETVSHSREKVIINNSNITVKRYLPKKHPAPAFSNEWQDGHRIFPNFGNGDNLLVTGSTHDEWGRRKTSDPETHRALMKRIMSKIFDNLDDIFDFEIRQDEDPEIGFVSFGSTSRSVYEAADFLRNNKKLKIREIRLKTVWPIDDQKLKDALKPLKYIFVPELNLGQLKYDIERLANKNSKIIPINKIGGGELITPEEIISKVLETISI